MTAPSALSRHAGRALGLLALVASAAHAQRSDSAAPKPIADNSFLVEEAYNQERGVVQHIGTLRRSRHGAWMFGFTQEWPAPGQRHQLSYGVPVQGGGDGGDGTGIGDVMLNYRYQAVGRDEERLWLAPRVSAILPTGSVAHGRGAGGPGVQVALPLSVDLAPSLVTHWNVGVTRTRARATNGVRATTSGWNAAASAIWLLAPTVNLMLETAWDRAQSLDDAGARATEESFVIVPGVRAAIDLASGMQIVPGLGVPIGVGPSRGERDLFLYFSVEHAFR